MTLPAAVPVVSAEPWRLRLGLCCQFSERPIAYRTVTLTALRAREEGWRELSYIEVVDDNLEALERSVEECARLGIGAFRISSQLLPLATHPETPVPYGELLTEPSVVERLERVRERARALDVRLSLHPDQFVVLNSTREEVVRSAVRELEYQGWLAELVGAEQMTLHGGSTTDGIPASLERLRRGLARVSERVRSLVAFENDDRLFAPADLLPFCERERVPFIYDAHHHRCHPDGMGEEEATDRMEQSWYGREGWAHLSSPRDGWDAPNPRPHADDVSPADVPEAWRGRRITVDVEAKAKEAAIVKLVEQGFAGRTANAERRTAEG